MASTDQNKYKLLLISDLTIFADSWYLVNFNHRSLPDTAVIQQQLLDFCQSPRKKDKCRFYWTETFNEASDSMKRELANATLLLHTSSTLLLVLSVDASDITIGVTSTAAWQYIGTLVIYITNDPEVLAVYQ